MKKAKDIADLAGRLTDAAATPLLQAGPVVETKRKRSKEVINIFLRLPVELHALIEAEAVSRTKATGKGVSVQQVIIGKLTETI